MKISHAFSPFTVVDRTVQTHRTVSYALRTQHFSRVQHKTSCFSAVFQSTDATRRPVTEQGSFGLKQKSWNFSPAGNLLPSRIYGLSAYHCDSK